MLQIAALWLVIFYASHEKQNDNTEGKVFLLGKKNYKPLRSEKIQRKLLAAF